jgi:hypothetical protein
VGDGVEEIIHEVQSILEKLNFIKINETSHLFNVMDSKNYSLKSIS